MNKFRQASFALVRGISKIWDFPVYIGTGIIVDVVIGAFEWWVDLKRDSEMK